jgi:glutaredoxin
MADLTLYWQPGCTSCLRTREFLREHGIDFASVNVRADAAALHRLQALGLRSVPVLVRGAEFVYGQDLATVARFVGIDATLEPLPPAVLVSRLLALLDTAAVLTGQLPADALPLRLPGRERTHLDLAYHVPQVAVGFLDAALGGRLTEEHFARKPPEHVRTAADAARLTRSVAQALAVWWGANQARLPQAMDTYYGRQPLHAVLERTTWHVAQHVRQLERLLELRGVAPRPGRSPGRLVGLPLPRDVWDPEVPLS